jgi:caffeoyl-CoA O-methyltransferase
VIFNDVDKEDYPRVLHLVSSRLRRGGLLITDNVLWSGRVAKTGSQEESTRAIREFNLRLYAMQEFFTTVIPLRDGLAIALKL